MPVLVKQTFNRFDVYETKLTCCENSAAAGLLSRLLWLVQVYVADGAGEVWELDGVVWKTKQS